MSSQGRLAFRVDSNFTSVPDLILEVYRESTNNRTYTLSHWVDSSFLAPQPCYRHHPPNGFGYHEIVSPFIQRIGVEFESTIAINNERLFPQNPKSLGFAVVGDATTKNGLEAPFDEENTQEKLKIEHILNPKAGFARNPIHRIKSTLNRPLADSLKAQRSPSKEFSFAG